MLTARIDPALGVRVLSTRALRYTTAASEQDDRPAHVRAASGLTYAGGRLVIVQDDAAFLATVADEVSAIALPRGAGGRRRFEVGLGNKADKLDLESCVAVDGELWAFGSGSSPARERIVVVGYRTDIVDTASFYARLREQLDGALNIEGVAVTRDEVWVFHRGNTRASDRPAAIRLARDEVTRWLHGVGALPAIHSTTWFDLGSIGGIQLGFTDAVAVGDRIFYLAAGEASANAIDDGAVAGSQLGVIERDGTRATPLARDGAPLKAEGLTFDPADLRRGWVAVDPDDVDRPAELLEIELIGPW